MPSGLLYLYIQLYMATTITDLTKQTTVELDLPQMGTLHCSRARESIARGLTVTEN